MGFGRINNRNREPEVSTRRSGHRTRSRAVRQRIASERTPCTPKPRIRPVLERTGDFTNRNMDAAVRAGRCRHHTCLFGARAGLGKPSGLDTHPGPDAFRWGFLPLRVHKISNPVPKTLKVLPADPPRMATLARAPDSRPAAPANSAVVTPIPSRRIWRKWKARIAD